MEPIFTLNKSETLPLTRDLAEQMRDMEPSPTERLIDRKRIEYLKVKAEDGMLVPFQWSKAKVNGNWLRMNGQHSSQMLCDLADEIFPDSMVVHLDEYLVDNRDGLATLFQQFDARRSSRSTVDVAGAYKGLHAQLKDIPLDIAKRGVDGVAYFYKNVQGLPAKGFVGDLKYRVFGREDLWPFLLWLPEIFTLKTPELKRNEIVAGMFATYEANEIACKDFWDKVQSGGDTTEANHPTTTLDAYYVKVKTETDSKKKPRPHELYQSAILAWNAFRNDKTLATIKKLKSDPEVLE
jgi:hypothetical protein